MADYKEFQGKTLDDAIQNACDYYGVAREKLEIDIVSDAKSGIFGLVGVKKATVRACRMQVGNVSLLGADDSEKKTAESGAQKTNERGKGREGKRPAPKALTEDAPRMAEDAPQASAESDAPRKRGAKNTSSKRSSQPERKHDGSRPQRDGKRPERTPRPPKESASGEGENADFLKDAMPELDLENCDQEKLCAAVREAVTSLVRPIVGEAPCEISVGKRKVRVSLDCGEAAGLLVGRDGQTLASVQYLLSRIVSRALGGSVHIQVDTGNYRERQDDKLRELALSLAVRVKEIKRSLSTRPLSAYQRRIIHLALESDEDIITRSSGEGAQRRVVVSLVKAGKRKDEADSSEMGEADL